MKINKLLLAAAGLSAGTAFIISQIVYKVHKKDARWRIEADLDHFRNEWYFAILRDNEYLRSANMKLAQRVSKLEKHIMEFDERLNRNFCSSDKLNDYEQRNAGEI